ncbi:MAG: hypothetical protein ACREAK_05095 [Nitrosarchaeum sp.]
MTFLNTFLEIEAPEPSSIVELVIIVFSIILFALAITAYKNNRIRRLKYAAVAFALFAVQLFVGYLDDVFDYAEDESLDLISSLITLGILLLFFFAIVIKKKTSD